MKKLKNFTKTAFFISVIGLVVLSTGCSEDETKEATGKQPPSEIPITQPPVATPDPYHAAGWYARTKVYATAPDGTVYSHTTAGIFGQLVQSSDEQDPHDIAGYGPAIFQIIFIPEFSTDTTVGFFSEYKNYDENSSEKKIWTFMIKNQNTIDLSNAPISISVEGTFNVKYRDDQGEVEYKETLNNDANSTTDLHLVDVDNATDYTVTQLLTANLSMQGLHTRTFRWVLGDVISTDYEPLSSAQFSSGRNGSVSDFQKSSARNSGGKFGLPPQ